MDHKGLKEWSKKAADWAHDYHEGLRDRPVRATMEPGALRDQLPDAAPRTCRGDGENLGRFYHPSFLTR